MRGKSPAVTRKRAVPGRQPLIRPWAGPRAPSPEGEGQLRAEEVGQQGRVQVQCLAASAGQQRRKAQRAAFNRVLNAVKVVLQLQRFAATLRLFRDLGVLGIVVGVKGDG